MDIFHISHPILYTYCDKRVRHQGTASTQFVHERRHPIRGLTMNTFSSGAAALSFFTQLQHPLRQPLKHNSLRCGKHEGTRTNHPLPTNTQ
jgi:hypothetical protein